MYVNSQNDNMFSSYTTGKRILCGRVIDSYAGGEYVINIVETESVDYKDVRGKVRLYVKYGTLFDYGDKIYAVGHISVPSKSKRKNDVDYRAYNFSRGIYANCFANAKSVFLAKPCDKEFEFAEFGMLARRKIKENINLLYPSEEAGILTALMLSDKSGVPEEFKDISSKVGIYHTMAASGLHVSIILTFFGLIIGKLRKRKLTAVLNIIFLVLIFIVIGYSPSISRAVIMSVLMCAAQITDSKADPYTSLALSAVIILAFRPYALFDTGFLLSFASTLGIIIIYKKLSALPKLKPLSVLFMSLASLFGTGALTALCFGRVTLFGVLSNIFIVPLAELILPLGYASVILGMTCFRIGDFISYAVYPLVRIYISVAEWFSKLPYASLRVSNLSAITAFIITVGIFFVFALIPVKGDVYEGRTTEEESEK